jgi:hypothetical protein
MFNFGKKTNEDSQQSAPDNTNISGVKSFSSGDDLIGIFDAEYKKYPEGLVFEQGGYISKGSNGWELFVPTKTVRLKASSDVDKFTDINFGFYGMNSKSEEGIMLKVSHKIPAYIDPVFKQIPDIKNGASVLQTVFFSADQTILHNHESFSEFILKLGRSGYLANINSKQLKALLDAAKYIEPAIDNTSGEITDEYKYVPLLLEIEALGSPREILHGQTWRRAHRTNQCIHTHLPTNGRWNDLIKEVLHDERDELNTPTDILALRHDIIKLNASQGASSSIVTFESDRTPRILRTFMMDHLSVEEQKELLTLANRYRTALTRETDIFNHGELLEIIRFYELVQKGTVNGFPMHE